MSTVEFGGDGDRHLALLHRGCDECSIGGGSHKITAHGEKEVGFMVGNRLDRPDCVVAMRPWGLKAIAFLKTS